MLAQVLPQVRDCAHAIQRAQGPDEAATLLHQLLESLQGVCWVVLTHQQGTTEVVVGKAGVCPPCFDLPLTSQILFPEHTRTLELHHAALVTRGKVYLPCPSEELWVGVAALLELLQDELLELLERQPNFQKAHENILAQLQAIMDNAPIGMALMNHQLRFLLINQKLAGYNRHSVQEHLGKTLGELYDNYDGQADFFFRKVLETGEPLLNVEVNTQIIPDSWWLANYFPVRTPSGDMLGVGCTVMDISERKRAERALQESESRFRQLADTAPVMIWMSSETGDTTYFSKQWLEFRGRSSEAELGGNWLEGIHPDDREACQRAFLQHAEERRPFELQFRLRRFDGTYRWIVDRGMPRFAPDGTYLGFVGACIDIHDRKVTEDAMEQMMQAQKRFVADAAHELRTPLTSIQGNLDILFRHRDIPPEDHWDILADVRREATRLGRLVHDMLTLARGDSGATMRQEEIELDQIVLNAWREMERINPSHGFVVKGMEPISTVGDRDRLKQLVLILLENAVKYSPAGTSISLSLTHDDGQVHLRVQDQGQGIGKEDLGRVFERFYRADQSRHRSEDPGGTGLGLPIAQWIVEHHKGQIWLESELDKGTTVHVRLPIQH